MDNSSEITLRGEKKSMSGVTHPLLQSVSFDMAIVVALCIVWLCYFAPLRVHFDPPAPFSPLAWQDSVVPSDLEHLQFQSLNKPTSYTSENLLFGPDTVVTSEKDSRAVVATPANAV